MSLTSSLRVASTRARLLGQGAWAWVTLRPGSRPRRVIRVMLVRSATIVRAHPRLAAGVNSVLRRFPGVHDRLRHSLQSAGRTSVPRGLSRRGEEIRLALVAAAERRSRRAR
jgi:O-antigen chain-terminating methyltransferase